MTTLLKTFTGTVTDHDESFTYTVRAETAIEAALIIERKFYAANPYGYTDAIVHTPKEV